jgi:hypothetical protein
MLAIWGSSCSLIEPIIIAAGIWQVAIAARKQV